MQLATLLKNMFLGDDLPGRAIDFAKIKKPSDGGHLTLDLGDADNHLLRYLIWPMNTFHLIARIFDMYDVYQHIVSIEHEVEYLKQLRTGNHASTWSSSLRMSRKYNEVILSPRFYGLLFDLFSARKTKLQIEELLDNHEYLKLLFELYIASDDCALRISSEMYQNQYILMSHYTDQLIARKSSSIIASLSQCDKSNGVIQFKSHTPQAGISLNSLSHDLAYIKPGVEVAALIGNSTQPVDSNRYKVLILPWPLEIEDDFFQQDNRPTLQMDEEFGFFTYGNHKVITCNMIMYALECCTESLPDLVVIPECAVKSDDKDELLRELRNCFSGRDIKPPVVIFGVFGEGDKNLSYGENSLEFFYENRFIGKYVGENQKKHHRWALDKTQLITYGLGNVLSTDKVKWWENCSTGGRKLVSYRDDYIHICPLICEDLARQEPIAPVVRSLGPDLVVALLLDGPQMKTRWPGRYSLALVDEPGCSVLSISPYGMTQRSTNDGVYSPSPSVALWSDTRSSYQLDLDQGAVGIVLNLTFEVEKQWSADGRGHNKKRLCYSSHQSVGNVVELRSIELRESQKEKLSENV